MKFRTLAAVLCLALPAAFAHAAPSSTFDTSAEGWKVADFMTANTYTTPDSIYNPIYSSSGGYISFADPSSGSFFFQASQSFQGNLSSFFGGTLSYSEKVVVSPGYGEWRGDPDVVLLSNGNVYVYQAAANAGANWTDFSINLSGNGWVKNALGGAAVSSSEFKSALSNVSALYIRGETISGVVETTQLDNVAITAVPEPETYALLLAGLGIVGMAARRRRS